MPKIKLEPVPQHIVVPDTNILWDRDKKLPASKEFDAFWENNSRLLPLILAVPDVVIGELQFQQATSAIKCATTVAEQMAELSGIAQSKYETRLDHPKIRKQIGDKLAKWVKNHGGSIEATPAMIIDWKRVIQDAIWRNPPFTFDSKDKDNEKGFRDALILETLSHICEREKETSKNIVFLCNDFLLRTSAENRLKHNKMALFFESLPDFESYIKLTQQKLTDKFVKSIQTHARSKFFTIDDGTSLYYREKIRRTISEKFSSELAVSAEPQLFSENLGLSSAQQYNWSIIEERWWINATRFDEIIQPREYHWISRVTVARLLIGSPAQIGIALQLNPVREEVQVIGFDVKWKANVKADGRFHDMSLLDIVKSEVSQTPSTRELLGQWKLRQTSTPT